MIISITGFDGVGKSTSVEHVREQICNCFNLKGISAKAVNQDSIIYQTVEELDQIYHQLNAYDVISCPFYFRTKEYHSLQNELMFADRDIFSDTKLITRISNMAKGLADIWFDRVIKKLHAAGKIIVCDRYYYDEIAYRSLYMLGQTYLENLYRRFSDADIRIFLYAEYETILQRNKNRDDLKGALFQRPDKMRELLNNLDEICTKYEMTTINIRHKNKAEVTNEIFEAVEPFLEQRMARFTD